MTDSEEVVLWTDEEEEEEELFSCPTLWCVDRPGCEPHRVMRIPNNRDGNRYCCSIGDGKKTDSKYYCKMCKRFVCCHNLDAFHKCKWCKNGKKVHENSKYKCQNYSPGCRGDWHKLSDIYTRTLKHAVSTHTVHESQGIAQNNVQIPTDKLVDSNVETVLIPIQLEIDPQVGKYNTPIVVYLEGLGIVSPTVVVHGQNTTVLIGEVPATVLFVKPSVVKGDIEVLVQAPEQYHFNDPLLVSTIINLNGTDVTAFAIDEELNTFTYRQDESSTEKLVPQTSDQSSKKRKYDTFNEAQLYEKLNNQNEDLMQDDLRNNFQYYQFSRSFSDQVFEMTELYGNFRNAIVNAISAWREKRDVYGRSLLFYVDVFRSKLTSFETLYELFILNGYSPELKDNFGLTSAQWRELESGPAQAPEEELDEVDTLTGKLDDLDISSASSSPLSKKSSSNNVLYCYGAKWDACRNKTHVVARTKENRLPDRYYCPHDPNETKRVLKHKCEKCEKYLCSRNSDKNHMICVNCGQRERVHRMKQDDKKTCEKFTPACDGECIKVDSGTPTKKQQESVFVMKEKITPTKKEKIAEAPKQVKRYMALADWEPRDGIALFKANATKIIKEIVGDNGLTYKTGSGYFQVLKKEKVAEKKKIIVVNLESGEMTRDGEALVELGVVKQATYTLAAKDGFAIFVQSTSPNRKIENGQYVLYDTEGEEIQVGSTPLSSVAPPTVEIFNPVKQPVVNPILEKHNNANVVANEVPVGDNTDDAIVPE